jgi:hypothetical protein
VIIAFARRVVGSLIDGVRRPAFINARALSRLIPK